jgi:hypothetical protein
MRACPKEVIRNGPASGWDGGDDPPACAEGSRGHYGIAVPMEPRYQPPRSTGGDEPVELAKEIRHVSAIPVEPLDQDLHLSAARHPIPARLDTGEHEAMARGAAGGENLASPCGGSPLQ